MDNRQIAREFNKFRMRFELNLLYGTVKPPVFEEIDFSKF